MRTFLSFMAQRARWALPALLPSVLLIPIVRHHIESQMALHMLIEFPLLLVSGMACFHLGRHLRLLRFLEKDWLGLGGLVLVSCVFAFWMIPAALDAALIFPSIATVKYLSWWLAGLATANSMQRSRKEILLFFAGNAVWMAATAGLLYLEATERLCVNYVFADQVTAGRGLLAISVLFVLYGASLLRSTEIRQLA